MTDERDAAGNKLTPLAALFSSKPTESRGNAYVYHDAMNELVPALELDPNEGVLRKLSHMQGQLERPLSYSLYIVLPGLTFEFARSYESGAITRHWLEGPYRTGFGGAARLIDDPSIVVDARRLQGLQRLCVAPYSAFWVFERDPEKTTKTFEGSDLRHDTVHALASYLDALDEAIRRDVTEGVETYNVVPKSHFYLGPQIGFSLVGFGDAVLKASKQGVYSISDERCGPVKDLARRAYLGSGFGDTLYVTRRLNLLGDADPRTMVTVPLREWQDLQRRAQ